jgi:tRNA pseudouridine32 synthase/23S rRNA pseudouridine746 synthase
LYEDDCIVVADKPAGLLSVPGRGSSAQDCLQSRLAAMRPSDGFLRAVHRLDQATSGVLVFARDQRSHRELCARFAAGAVDKEYLAVVGGRIVADDGQIRLRLRPDPGDRPRQVVDEIRGRETLTLYRVVARRESATVVALRPRTGRTHQLRVHCAAGIGHPIVGDRLYGGAPAERLMLHAHRLELSHPATGERLAFESLPPF